MIRVFRWNTTSFVVEILWKFVHYQGLMSKILPLSRRRMQSSSNLNGQWNFKSKNWISLWYQRSSQQGGFKDSAGTSTRRKCHREFLRRPTSEIIGAGAVCGMRENIEVNQPIFGHMVIENVFVEQDFGTLAGPACMKPVVKQLTACLPLSEMFSLKAATCASLKTLCESFDKRSCSCALVWVFFLRQTIFMPLAVLETLWTQYGCSVGVQF